MMTWINDDIAVDENAHFFGESDKPSEDYRRCGGKLREESLERGLVSVVLAYQQKGDVLPLLGEPGKRSRKRIQALAGIEPAHVADDFATLQPEPAREQTARWQVFVRAWIHSIVDDCNLG